MTYNFIENVSCKYDPTRHKWVCLGRTSASQSSHAIDEFGRVFGWGQNNGYESGVGDFEYLAFGTYNRPDLYRIELPTQLAFPGKCLKVSSGEEASAALNHHGELYGWGYAEGPVGDNCASFALPNDSGLGSKGWMGVPSPGNQIRFPTPTRIAPGYTFKDIAFDYYHAIAIGKDDERVYTWGYDDGYGALGIGSGETSRSTPQLVTTITEKAKFVDCELFCSCAVTKDNKVYIWSDDWWNDEPAWVDWHVFYPKLITGLPSDADIVQMSCSPNGVYVVLSNKELWAAGSSALFGDQGVAYPTGTSTFKQVTCLGSRGINLAKTTALGSGASSIIDEDGNIWGWSSGSDYFVGNTAAPAPDWELPNLCAADYEGQIKFVDVIFNTHQRCFSAIDEDGWLYTWGYQNWGPHLGTNTVGYASQVEQDDRVEGVVYLQEIASLADPAVDVAGAQTFLNMVYQPESEYVQPLPQTLRHRPCGHWHLRLFEQEDLWPANCWMPSVSIYENHLMFVACGKHLQQGGDTGCEVMIFDYDMDANIWTLANYTNFLNAANAPGGASIYDDTMAFANWKADATGTGWYDEHYTNFCLGVWVLDRGNDYAMNYTEFAMSERYMQGKVAAYSGGIVAVAYENAAGQLLVQVTTDYGATWNLRKTVGVDADRKDWSICIDKNGYIYLAHQVTSSAVMIERSVDNGLNWTTQAASNTLISNLVALKIVSDNGFFYLFGNDVDHNIEVERSVNSCVSWSTFSDEPGGSSHVSSACYYNFPDTTMDHVLMVAARGELYNYIFEDGYSQWANREISQISYEGDKINTYQGYDLADLNGYGGRFAYSAYTFYSYPVPYVAVALSVDNGVTWFVRSSPLGWSNNAETTNFRGCPLFCLEDVPHLNHIWNFEKSTWAADFVKQKDKYKVEVPCICPLGNRCE